MIPSAYRADVFHDGVDGGRVRRELGLSDDALVVGVAGRLVLDKGHTYLLRAAAALQSTMPSLTLLFAGLGPNEGTLRREARELGLEDRVRFLGFRADIAEVEAAFDVAVLPSIGCDASSASLKEAMALGVPVIASDVGGARSIIEDGSTGFIVRPGDPAALETALRRVLTDRESARAVARRAREEVSRRYSVKRLCDQTLQAYATAVTESCAHRGLRTRPDGVGARKTA